MSRVVVLHVQRHQHVVLEHRQHAGHRTQEEVGTACQRTRKLRRRVSVARLLHLFFPVFECRICFPPSNCSYVNLPRAVSAVTAVLLGSKWRCVQHDNRCLSW